MEGTASGRAVEDAFDEGKRSRSSGSLEEKYTRTRRTVMRGGITR
jgi:hypothetical protein